MVLESWLLVWGGALVSKLGRYKSTFLKRPFLYKNAFSKQTIKIFRNEQENFNDNC